MVQCVLLLESGRPCELQQRCKNLYRAGRGYFSGRISGSDYLAPFILSSSFGFSIVHCYTGIPLIFFPPYATDEKVTVFRFKKKQLKKFVSKKEGDRLGVWKTSLGKQSRGPGNERSPESMAQAWWTTEEIVMSYVSCQVFASSIYRLLEWGNMHMNCLHLLNYLS